MTKANVEFSRALTANLCKTEQPLLVLYRLERGRGGKGVVEDLHGERFEGYFASIVCIGFVRGTPAISGYFELSFLL